VPPQKNLELSLIGKAKIDQGNPKGPLCGGALSKLQNVITQPNQKGTIGVFAWAPETRFTR
jgi:hypothetical protein